MKYTPIYQLPYVEDGDRARAYPAATKTMAERIEAAMLQNGQVPVGADAQGIIKRLNAIDAKNTDWQPFVLKSGFVAVNGAAVRIRNGRVELRGSIQNSAGQYPNGYTELGTLPPDALGNAGNSPFRPSAYLRIPCATYNGFTANFVVNPGNGVIQVGYSASTALSDAFYMGGQGWDAV